ncbi:hypothetical protein D6777_04480 [Candidatus Woesearchaeota archaeon]|nr:MAG: hypothetical protein D6777_04480 [Candidatus Woesearchaeota archaeon]
MPCSKKNQITIGGVPGAGKTTTAKKLAKILGYNFYSVGDFRRKIAVEKFGTDINTLNSLEEAKLLLKDLDLNEMSDMDILSKVEHLGLVENDIPNLRKIMNVDTDIEADNMQKELGIKSNNFIIEGRLAWKFCPSSFKVYFDCDPEVGAERILRDNRDTEKNYYSVDEVKEANLVRIESDKKRYREKYGEGYDCYNPKNFNYVINTTNLTKDEVVTKILKAYETFLGIGDE